MPKQSRAGWSIAVPAGGRFGRAGLGNQVIPMGKAWIAATVLDQRYVEVPWSLNPRGYRREFEASRLDLLKSAALRSAGKRVVTAEEYREWGGVDYGAFISNSFSKDVPRIIAHDSEMEGGFASIVGARSFLRSRLLGTSAVQSSRTLAHFEYARLTGVTIGIHFRAGDFGSEAALPGTFNRRLPMSWYQEVIGNLSRTLRASNPIFYVVTEPSSVTEEFHRAMTHAAGGAHVDVISGSVTEDLAILTGCDLLVCSVSSFSMLAAFLSESPYVWYGPHLTETDDGREIWPANMRPYTPSPSSADPSLSHRGLPMPCPSEELQGLAEMLDRTFVGRRRENDLISYGRLSKVRFHQ